MIKGVIFDLDGTLIDSMTVWSKVDRAFLGENGITEPPEDISDCVRKMPVDESSQYFIDRFGLSCTKEYVIKRIEELVRKEYEENIQLKPFTDEILGLLEEKGIPFGIATATYKALAEAVLKRCGIYGRFGFLLSDAEYPRGKNFPDIFLGAAELLGVAPEEVLVVEDSLHCIETALKAGFVTAAVYDSVSAADSEQIRSLAHYYADDLRGIADILRNEVFT